jgi:hypothetical protein
MDFLRCPRKNGEPDLPHKLESPDIGSIVARERPSPSHIGIIRAAAALRRNPSDDLIRVFDFYVRCYRRALNVPLPT